MGPWRFLNTGPADGVTNMAVDEAILKGVGCGSSPPTVRVYAWAPPAVSIGYSQDVARELDLAACARRGLDVVRRPTGGRAVLHAGELTYAVVGPSGLPPLGSTIKETYRAIAGALLEGLRELGIEGDLERAGTAPTRRSRGASPPCFASSGRFEIVVRGKKLVGSAQRRVGRAVLQHGSLLIDGTHAGLADVIAIDDQAALRSIRELLRAKTTDLSSILERPVSFDEVARVTRTGFERSWGFRLRESGLSDPELEAARSVASECVVGDCVTEKAVDSAITRV